VASAGIIIDTGIFPLTAGVGISLGNPPGHGGITIGEGLFAGTWANDLMFELLVGVDWQP
jgi:hypothetical protein